MKKLTPFQIGETFRSVALSSAIALASVGASFGQEDLVLEDLKLIRPVGEACTVTFGAEEGQQIMAWSSTDLKCWTFAGVCHEVYLGDYKFVDYGAVELPGQFYRFESFNPEVPLPPQLEQLRMELGDEGFAEWLHSNFDQSGTLQGISQDQVMQLDESGQEQVEETERILDLWLKDYGNESVPMPPEEQLPPAYEDIRQVWGDYDFTKLLVGHLDETGNFQGICDDILVGWELNDPEVFRLFQEDEAKLNQWVDGFVFELPPSFHEDFMPEIPEEEMEEEFHFPQDMDQLRIEIGDEAFINWLHRNLEESGNFQGVPEDALPEYGAVEREGFDILEGQIQTWLNEQQRSGQQ